MTPINLARLSVRSTYGIHALESRAMERQRPRPIERQRPRVSGSGQRTSAATGHVEFHRNKCIIITRINCNFKLAVQDVALAYYALLSATGHVQLHCNEYIILMGIHCNFKCAVQYILSRCQILELAETSRIMLSFCIAGGAKLKHCILLLTDTMCREASAG